MKKPAGTEYDRLKREIAIYNEVGKTLTSSLTVNEVIQQILYKVAELFGPENWSLLLVDEDKKELYFEIAVGEAKHAQKFKDLRLKIGEGVAGWVAKTGRPLIVPSVDEEPHFCSKVDTAINFYTESIICIPLKIRDRVLGVIEFVNRKDILPLSDNDIDILTTVADYAAIALENARNYENVRRLTITDDISGLYNSRPLPSLLQFEIERARYEQGSYSIIFFDLDSFKQVNDTYGHLIGSRLLGEVGKLVAKNLKEKYAAARYGGDEFVIVLSGADKKEAFAFCTKLKNQLNRHSFFTKEGLNIRLTASFGIATYPDDADTKDMLLHMADERMYKVKDNRKNGIAST